MNMKKLIDETDFDNLSQISKKWKTTKPKEINTSTDFQKENQSENSLPEPAEEEKKLIKP